MPRSFLPPYSGRTLQAHKIGYSNNETQERLDSSPSSSPLPPAASAPAPFQRKFRQPAFSHLPHSYTVSDFPGRLFLNPPPIRFVPVSISPSVHDLSVYKYNRNNSLCQKSQGRIPLPGIFPILSSAVFFFHFGSNGQIIGLCRNPIILCQLCNDFFSVKSVSASCISCCKGVPPSCSVVQKSLRFTLSVSYCRSISV